MAIVRQIHSFRKTILKKFHFRNCLIFREFFSQKLRICATLAQNTLPIQIQGINIYKKNLDKSVEIIIPRLPPFAVFDFY